MAAKRFKPVILPEKQIVNAVKHYFALDPNVRVWRRNTGAVESQNRFVRFGEPGMSDFFGIVREVRCPRCGKILRRGVHLEIECKRYGGRLTAEQKNYLETVKKMGGIAVVAIPYPTETDPTGFASLKTTLRSVSSERCDKCELL